MGDSNSLLILGAMLVLALVLSMGMQALRTKMSKMGKVVAIASNLKFNVNLLNSLGERRKLTLFKTGGWEKNRDKVKFLPEDLMVELGKLFDIIAEINGTIDAGIRHGSMAYTGAIDVEKLRGPMESCQQKLTDWIYENMNNPEYIPKKRSIFRR